MNAACFDCLAATGPGPFGMKVVERRQKGCTHSFTRLQRRDGRLPHRHGVLGAEAPLRIAPDSVSLAGSGDT